MNDRETPPEPSPEPARHGEQPFPTDFATVDLPYPLLAELRISLAGLRASAKQSSELVTQCEAELTEILKELDVIAAQRRVRGKTRS